jgi:hypothetical protein
MSDPLTLVLGVGQLGVLVEIARRIGSLRSDLGHLKRRVRSLESEAT